VSVTEASRELVLIELKGCGLLVRTSDMGLYVVSDVVLYVVRPVSCVNCCPVILAKVVNSRGDIPGVGVVKLVLRSSFTSEAENWVIGCVQGMAVL